MLIIGINLVFDNSMSIYFQKIFPTNKTIRFFFNKSHELFFLNNVEKNILL